VRGAPAALLLLLGAAAAAEETLVELRPPAAVAYRMARDLDGDGCAELLLLDAKEAWFWKGRRGPMPAEPDARWALPEGTALVDVAERTLVARTASGYFALGSGAPPERLPWRSGPGLPALPRSIVWRAFRADVDRDGRSDLVDVSFEGYRIDYAGGGSLLLPARPSASLQTQSSIASERHVVRYSLGEWRTGDFDADPAPDFAYFLPGRLVLFPGDASGRQEAARSVEIALPESAKAEFTFVDWNGDGKTDALAVDRDGGLATVYVADARRGLAAAARTALAVPGRMRPPVVEDFDGDGRPDLALPYFPQPTVQDAVRWFVRGEVEISVPLFLNRGGREGLPRLADRQISLPVKLRLGSDDAGRLSLAGLVIAEYAGDLDGDGRKDLLVSKSPDRVGVHRGVREGVFEEEAGRTIGLPDASPYETVASGAADLNGDGLSDIILHYRGAGRRPDRVMVLLSRKP
jgi:hypothetical protein